MARADLEDRWTVADDPEAVRGRVDRFLADDGWEVTDEDDEEVRARQGSHLWTRLLGAWFVGLGTLPKTATVTVLPAAGGARVRAVVEEAMGFGLFDGHTRGRYEQAFERWVEDLRDATEG